MKEKHPEFSNMIGCYFAQNYSIEFDSLDSAIKDIILGNNKKSLTDIINEMEDILKKYPEENILA